MNTEKQESPETTSHPGTDSHELVEATLLTSAAFGQFENWLDQRLGELEARFEDYATKSSVRKSLSR